ncbi:phage major capsid protein [Arthrobacter gyeryongensis]
MRELLNERKAELRAAATAILEKAEAENRDVTEAEASEFERIGESLESVSRQLDRSAQFNEDFRKAALATESRGRSEAPVKFVNRATGAPALRSGQPFGEHELVRAERERGQLAEDAAMATYGGVAEFVRSLSTTGASAVVPTVWASQIIDIARANAAVMKAGATILPMDANTVQVGRLTGDATAAFRAEGSAITASDPTFDNVTLTAKSLNALVIGSMEWFDDAPNADGLVINSIGKAIGLAIDKVALYGGITSGAGSINLPTPPNPRGVLAALNAVRPANVIGGSATNGTAVASYNELIDLDYTVENLNEVPTGLILPSRLAQKYAKLQDTTNQPMRRPDDLSDLPFYVSNQVASGMTQGTSTTAADAFVGDWTELLIGQRLGLRIQVLTERYAEFGQIGIVATWRGDVQPARTSAFAVYRYLNGA